jgi:hypothetical protein
MFGNSSRIGLQTANFFVFAQKVTLLWKFYIHHGDLQMSKEWRVACNKDVNILGVRDIFSHRHPIKEDNWNCHRARTLELHNWPFHLPDSTCKSNLTSNKQKRTNVLKSSPRIFCMLLHACKPPCEHSALETTITMVFLLNLFWTHYSRECDSVWS